MTENQATLLLALARYVMHKNGSTSDLNASIELVQAEIDGRLCPHNLLDTEPCGECGRTNTAPDIDFNAVLGES